MNENLPKDLFSLVGTKVVIVADDGVVNSKFVGLKGEIIGWRKGKYGRFIPKIKLFSGQIISNSKLWWDKI